jgi:hypothetical protein
MMQKSTTIFRVKKCHFYYDMQTIIILTSPRVLGTKEIVSGHFSLLYHIGNLHS